MLWSGVTRKRFLLCTEPPWGECGGRGDLIQKAISHVSADMVITPTANAALIGSGTMAAAVSNTTTNNSNVTYNFNQTNNSPKALSRFDIYRQSKNLLSGVKR